jgi:hypothetical protein
MTLIECFTRSHVDNISACLRLQPDRMAMIGNAVKEYCRLPSSRRRDCQIYCQKSPVSRRKQGIVVVSLGIT